MSEATVSFDVKDRAKRLTYHPRTRLAEFRALGLSERSAVFNELSATVRLALIDDLSFDEAVELLDHLDPQRAQHILARLPSSSRRKKIISRLKNDLYEKAEVFLHFHPHASINLLHLNYIYLPDSTTVKETAEVIEKFLEETGKLPVILTSNEGELSGEVPLTQLVRARSTSKLKQYTKSVKSIKYNADHRQAIDIFSDNPHHKIVLEDSDGSILGILYSDDVLDLFVDQSAASLYNFAGVTPTERSFDGVIAKVSHRYRWLILNLATGFLAGGVVAAFSDTLSTYVLLAMYMPIVAGMGGNAATQTLAVMVRGISIGEITLKNCFPAVWNEVKAGFVNGVINGTLVFFIAMIFSDDIKLGLVAALSVVASLVIAGFFGSIVPLILKHFGKDPATSATVFITTATDVFGFLFLLGLATLVLF